MQNKHVHRTHPDIVKRLKRAEGHLRRVIAMVEEPSNLERSALVSSNVISARVAQEPHLALIPKIQALIHAILLELPNGSFLQSHCFYLRICHEPCRPAGSL